MTPLLALPIYFIALAAPAPAQPSPAERAAAIAVVVPVLREYAEHWPMDHFAWRDQRMAIEEVIGWLEAEAEEP